MAVDVPSPALRRRYAAPMADQSLYCERTLHDGVGRCLLSFAGRVDAQRMARAVRLTRDAQPVLGCRLVLHPWRPYWERRADLDDMSHCPLVDGDDADAALQRFVAAAPDPCRDLPLHVALFRAQSDTLCIRISHEVADAGGLVEYLALLAATYRALGTDPAYQPRNCGDGERGMGQVLRLMGLGRLARACRHMPNPFVRWGFPVEGQGGSGAFAVRRLGPDRLAALKAYAREHQATLNDVLVTGFFRALVAIIDPPVGIPLAVQNTTSLRRFRPAGDAAICNLVSMFYQSMPRVADEPFAETLARARAVLKARMDDDSWLASLVLAESLYACGFALAGALTRRTLASQARSGKLAPIYANLGVIPPEVVDFGSAVVEDITIHGPVVYPPLAILTIHTYGGTMTFTSSSRGGAATMQRLERLLDLCVGELPS